MSEQSPTTAAPAPLPPLVVVPAFVLDSLVAIALKTDPGRALWMGFACGHPDLDHRANYRIAVGDGQAMLLPAAGGGAT